MNNRISIYLKTSITHFLQNPYGGGVTNSHTSGFCFDVNPVGANACGVRIEGITNIIVI